MPPQTESFALARRLRLTPCSAASIVMPCAAFARTPLAKAGWKLFTLSQRRNHLLALYCYRSA
jgi:hypothetical protein